MMSHQDRLIDLRWPNGRKKVALAVLLLVGVVEGALLEASVERVRDTRFNYKRGFYSSSITVLIQSKTTGARIRYTLDGGAPSPDRGLGNSNPVTVVVDKTTTLRAIAYKDGMLPSNIDTQTYIFLDDVLKQPARIRGYPQPVLRSGQDEMVLLDYEMDPEVVGDPRYRYAILRGLKAIPSLSIVMDKEDLFGRVPVPESSELDMAKSGVYWAESGAGSTKPASIELLYAHQPARNVQVDGFIQGHSWRIVKRAFRLVFKKDYGSGKFESSLFTDAPLNSDTAVKRCDRIVLRSGKNRSWATNWNPAATCYTRDQWARDTQITMSGLGAHGNFVHLYLNGIYWGLYNACERPDARFLADHMGGAEEGWFSAKFYGRFQGVPTRWNTVRGELKNRDLSNLQSYDELLQYLDVKQFSDYLILNWYMRMLDWPANNWYAGHRVDPPSLIRFFVWDAEMIWSAEPPPAAWVHPQFLAEADTRNPNMVGIWHALRRNKAFMTLFADRVYVHCFNDGALSEGRAIARWRALNDYIEDAVIAESARWGDARESLGAPLRTRDNTFYPEVERVAERMRGNVLHFINVLRKQSYYPSIDPPRLGSDGLVIASGRKIKVVNPNRGAGTIYYTVNGEDPRNRDGTVSPSARVAQNGGQIIAGPESVLKARIQTRGEWSALEIFPKGERRRHP
jgi:hypothetical protein